MRVKGLLIAVMVCMVMAFSAAPVVAAPCPDLDEWRWDNIPSYRLWYMTQLDACTMYDDEYLAAEEVQDAAIDEKIKEAKQERITADAVITFVLLLVLGI